MSRKKILTLAAALMGCSALGAGSTAAIAAANSSTSPAPSDVRITHEVQQKLTRDLQGSVRNVYIQTKDGVVTLSGRADTGLTVAKALAVARQVPGVMEVKNRLSVQQ